MVPGHCPAMSDKRSSFFPDTSGGKGLALLLLFIVSVFNYGDRWMLGVLIPDIKADLGLSDAQVGFITGLAFSLFYAVMAIPIARLADRYSRKVVVSVSLAAWSLMTAVCGLAQNFWQLAVARVLVGVGEAGASPPSHAIIADLFPRNQRAAALATYALGGPAGVFLGFLLGSQLVEAYGWRVALFSFGIPGILMAFVVYRFLKEPARGQSDGEVQTAPPPALGETLKSLLSRKTFIHNTIASGFFTIVYLGLVSWLPSYYDRSFDMGMTTIGAWLAVILGLSQLIGIFAGGALADKLAANNLKWLPMISSLGVLASVPLYLVVFSVSDPIWAMIALFPPFVLALMQAGPQHATTQGVSPAAMRATAAATYLLIVNLMGGLGPLFVGLLSDMFEAELGDAALGRALLIIAIIFSLWSALHFFLASRTFQADVERTKTQMATEAAS